MSATEKDITWESLERAFDALSRQQTKIEELERRVNRLQKAYDELAEQLTPEATKDWPHK